MRTYIASRNRTPSSASPSGFQFALERPLELPEGARGTIDSFTCSNVWEAVLAGVNQTLYFQYNYLPANTLFPLVLEPGDISSVAALAAKLTTGLAAAAPFEPPVTVTVSGNRLVFACPGLGVGQRFTVVSRQTLNSGLSAYTRPAGGWGDASALVGAMTKDIQCINSADAGSLTAAQINNLRTSQMVNLSPYQTLYLHSHIGDNDSYGPNGESTVIASIVVANTVPGDLITDHHNGLLASPIQVPPLLGIMHFSLRSYDGKIIDT
jgi:hypothetical protein